MKGKIRHSIKRYSFHCPHCGKVITKNASDIVNIKEIPCPYCEVKINQKGFNLTEVIDKGAEKLDELIHKNKK